MQLTPELAISVGTIFGAVAGSWAVSKWRIDRHEKDLDEHKSDVWREVSKLREWRHTHESESSKVRLEIEKDFSKVYVSLADTNGKFAQIMDAVEEIRKVIALIQRKKEE